MEIFELGHTAAKKLEDLIDDYEKNGHGIPDTPWWHGKEVPDREMLLKTQKSSIYDSSARKSTIEGHWNAVRKLYEIYINEIPYSSNQLGFRYAYENLVGKDIDRSDSRKLRNLGANLIPLDPAARKAPSSPDVHTVFRTSQQGIAMLDWGSKKIVRTGKASGGYDDSTMPETLLYDTAANFSSILRARHLEFLSEGVMEDGGQGLILQLACLLRPKGVDGMGPREYKSMFLMSYCEVIPLSRWPRDLLRREKKKYHHELFLPYLLRPIDPDNAERQLKSLRLMGGSSGDFEIRTPLSMSLVKKWNYENATKRSNREILNRYVERNDVSCPHVTPVITGRQLPCGTKLKTGGFHIGHIFSQKWCDAYSIFQESVHHPDNLYLSCVSCNASLNQGFPPKEMLKHINRNKMTLGDLIRQGHLD